MPDITQDITIAAAPEQVYAALTQQEGLRAWWTRDASAEPVVGSLAEFRFDQGATVFGMEMTMLEPGKRVEWQVRRGPPYWHGTTVAWALAPAANGTALRFAHRGFAAADTAYEETRAGWAYFLDSLKAYLETGKGTPHGA